MYSFVITPLDEDEDAHPAVSRVEANTFDAEYHDCQELGNCQNPGDSIIVLGDENMYYCEDHIAEALLANLLGVWGCCG
jgi:hypothetical protein